MLFASALILLVSSCFGSDPGIRLIEVNGYLLVPAHVNGHGPYLFLLDTGATTSSVTPHVASAAGLVPRNRVVVATAAGESIAGLVPNVDLRVGGSIAGSVETLIQPLEKVRSIDDRIQGVLGQTFLTQFPCLIDYTSHRLWLGEEAVRRAENISGKLVAQRVDGRLALQVKLESFAAPRRLILDSGTSALVLSCASNCPQLAGRGSIAELQTNTGARRVRQGTLDTVSVGGILIRRPAAVLMEGSPSEKGEDGLLPAKWFSMVYLGRDNVVGLAK